KLKGQKQAALVKLQELLSTDSLVIKKGTSNFLNPQIIGSDQNNKIKRSHPLLQSIEESKKQLEYSGKSQKSAALPSVNLLGGIAYRGTGIGEDGVVSD